MDPAGIGASVEGFHAVAAALDARRVLKLTVESGRLRRPLYEQLIERAEEAGVVVELVDDVRPEAVTDAPQGVVAEATPIAPTSLEEAVALIDPPGLLVLDHIEDPRNVGAVARTAVAAGVPALVVARRRSAPLGPTAFKAAAGALERIAVVEVSSLPEALKRLGGLGVWCLGLDGSAERSILGHHLLTEPVALVIGAEGGGLSRLVAERCDELVRLPMAGDVESLNASVAAGLAVYELSRMRSWV